MHNFDIYYGYEIQQAKKRSKKDVAWQQKIEQRIKAEKVKLDNPSGKEQFFKLLSRPFNKK